MEEKISHLVCFYYYIITFTGVLYVDSNGHLGSLVFSLKRTFFSVLVQLATQVLGLLLLFKYFAFSFEQ